jgi:uncharacterized protein
MRNSGGQGGPAGKIIILCVLILGVTAATTNANQEQALKTANRFLANVTAGHFAEATDDFDKTMSSVLPAEKLQTVWEGLLTENGHFKGTGRVRTEIIQGYQIIYVGCQFERAGLDAKIAVDTAGHLAGLYFVPTIDDWASPAYSNPSAYQESKVMIGSKPWVLPGILTVPRPSQRYPAVVLVHGSGPNDMDETIGPNKPFKDLALGLASKGIAVLRYDKRTKVYPQQFYEKIPRFTPNEETVDDAIATIQLLQQSPDIDRQRIYILGHSLGGNLAPRIAEKSGQVAGLIILAGNTQPFGDSLVQQITYQVSLSGNTDELRQKRIEEAKKWRDQINDTNLKPDTPVDILGSRIPGSYWLDLRSYQPVQTALKLKLPMLILQGERDYQVTTKDYEGWKNALENKPGIILRTYPTLNHLFMTGEGQPGPADYNKAGHVAEEVIREIADWIIK